MFAVYADQNAPQEVRDNAKRKLDSWLKRHDKTWGDTPAILLQAAEDDKAAPPPPPPSDPRDTTAHPFDNPEFTAVGLVEDATKRYVTMKPYLHLLYALWIIFTHVYKKFRTAPRIHLTSEDSGAGKSIAMKVAKCLAYRPNPETTGTGAAIIEFIDEGPGTIFLDEEDQLDAEAEKKHALVWNVGYERGAKRSLIVKGKRKLVDLHAPMMLASVGDGFFGPTQKTRTYKILMESYVDNPNIAMPERIFDDEDTKDLDQVYSFLRHFASHVKLNTNPPMPAGLSGRAADNARGLLAVADACGEELGRRAREAIMIALERETAEKPQYTIVRHGLVIFEVLGLELIGSVRFNKELLRLDLPDARWIQYRGARGEDYEHPMRLFEQAALLKKVDIVSKIIRPTPGAKQCNGYSLEQFQGAARKYNIKPPSDAETARARLRLVGPPSD